ncbi:MAG TPA: family 78 glycoside hydrolase catalytic domain, partial [Tepidisphaeraceae bacterium]|nr:family 78 glycoside hydrolase catalytic domain [Tepidisphaeraceae bacterium]
TVLYDTFDVTDRLRAGDNAIGIILGNGMYNIQPSAGRYVKFTHSFGPLKAIARLQLEYDDGSREVVATDSHWQAAPGPITYSNIYGGEDFDARRASARWDQPDFSPGSHWEPAIESDGPGGALRGHSVSAPPIRAIEVEQPISANVVRPHVTVYDLGQNASHMPRIAVHGPAGSAVRVIPSELLGKDGLVDRASCVQDAGGPAWWQYTLAGGGQENYFPKFFYQGCRYLQVECVAPEGSDQASQFPVVDSLEGVVVHSSSEPIGSFECSNALFNKTYALVRWAQRSNMMSLMTDCPQREKLGWLEQLHLNGPSLRYNFRMDRLYAKEMNDMADAQLPIGFVPNIAPEYFMAQSKVNEPFRNSPEWGSSFILAPWQQYLFTGDLSLFAVHYDQMVKYAHFLGTMAKADIIHTGLGDWYDLGPKPPWGSQLTPPAFTATAIYFYDLTVMARGAELLGKSEDAAAFRARAADVRAAFNREFYNETRGDYATGSQCADAMPLALGIVEPENRASVLAALVADIELRGNALSAGDVGYRFVIRALADAGRSDVLFTMNNQSDRPGYGMQIRKGATSLTEKWDASVGSFGSQDHFMLGQINEWFFHDLTGIQMDEQHPGFAHILIKPAVAGDVSWVKASYQSDRGIIKVYWHAERDGVHLAITIPANTTATVFMPTHGGAGIIREINGAASNALPADGFSVGSGSYEFASRQNER